MMEELVKLAATAPVLCSTDTTLLFRERYETIFGIFNHMALGAERPLALVAMHVGENNCVGSSLDERIKQFAELEVGKHFNISLKDMFDLPTDIVNIMFEVSNKRQNVTVDAADKLAKELDKSQ